MSMVEAQHQAKNQDHHIGLAKVAVLVGVMVVAQLAPAWAVCGDTILDPGELCDDGNIVDGDGCSSECDVCLGNDMSGDADADGYCATDSMGNSFDCDDASNMVHPEISEQCNGVDDDCDGLPGADEVDQDGDGWMICAGDCVDTDPYTAPWAVEECNSIDDDCDGIIPDRELDLDGDGWWPCAGDCNDADADQSPENHEICNGIDDDCDGDTDPDCEAEAAGANRGCATSGRHAKFPWAMVILGVFQGIRRRSLADRVRLMHPSRLLGA